MTSSLSRRRLLGAAAAAAGAGLFGPAPAAHAADQPAVDLPAVGQTLAFGVTTTATTLLVDLPPPLPVLTFTGSWSVEITATGSDGCTYRTVDLALDARHPQFGLITLRAPDGEPGTGTLRPQADGGVLDQWGQPLRITFERCGREFGPFRFVSSAPAAWTGTMPAYPPPPPGVNPDGSPTGRTLYRTAGPIRFGLDPDRANPPADNCPLTAGPLPQQSAARADADPEYLELQGMDCTISRQT
ncbi:hypothetical protein GCM10010441_13980 [Kitasatospora paracochleata]|uniref:Secreted protein n=1 Tax=Kitasatospora paracochleata TaxID=58354 RepID=A0ABT1JAN9_9ACTN|nr:twin-arginine translocation signal domain-containing protein [Kitasatospora paracochleata]MCP2314505.1 hypothetical protein [Kitasatospora paracochleata]